MKRSMITVILFRILNLPPDLILGLSFTIAANRIAFFLKFTYLNYLIRFNKYNVIQVCKLKYKPQEYKRKN
ncbi:MAG TPA: hypothetical protein PLC80_12035 [Draconibacterium sp.]|nr:hypothetical protein [Draconibacterium sp.]